MNEKLENRVLLKLYALSTERDILRGHARREGVTLAVWIHDAISARLIALGDQPLGDYPAEGHGGARRGRKGGDGA